MANTSVDEGTCSGSGRLLTFFSLLRINQDTYTLNHHADPPQLKDWMKHVADVKKAVHAEDVGGVGRLLAHVVRLAAVHVDGLVLLKGPLREEAQSRARNAGRFDIDAVDRPCVVVAEARHLPRRPSGPPVTN